MSEFAVHRSTSPALAPSLAQTRETPLAALLCALCGAGLLWVVGFADIESVHNAAHDTRHSASFPCH